MLRFVAAHALGLALYVLILNALEGHGFKPPLYLAVILGVAVMYGLHWWLVERVEAFELQRDLDAIRREVDRRIYESRERR